MQVLGARAARTLRGRIEKGEDVLECAELLAMEHESRAAELHALGVLDEVTLVGLDPARRSFGQEQVIRGPVEVLALWVAVRGGAGAGGAGGTVRAHALLARGSEVVEGVVLAAKSGGLEFEMRCWNGDAWALRDPDRPPVARAATPAPVSSSHEARPPSAAHDPPVRSLVEAARALEAAPAPRPERAPEYEPEEGDLLEHPTFGLCEVVGEAESGNVLIKLVQTGSRREISLAVFDVVPREPRDGKRAFLLRARRR